MLHMANDHKLTVDMLINSSNNSSSLIRTAFYVTPTNNDMLSRESRLHYHALSARKTLTPPLVSYFPFLSLIHRTVALRSEQGPGYSMDTASCIRLSLSGTKRYEYHATTDIVKQINLSLSYII